MIWSFSKGAQQLTCEIRREIDGDEYEFVVTATDGSAQVTRFTDPTGLIEHSTSYLEQLVRDGWRAETVNG
jgi:hypothetical protein